MHGSRLVALIFLGDEDSAGASHALLTMWGPGLAVQDVAHGSSPGWQKLPVPARCLNRGEKKNLPNPTSPGWGIPAAKGQHLPPSQHCWEALGIKVSPPGRFGP